LAGVSVAVQMTIEEVQCVAPVAGPEDLFRQEVIRTVEDNLERQPANIEDTITELSRLYAGKFMDAANDQLPLSMEDRSSLCAWYDRYLELRDHPHLSFQKVPAPLEEMFQSLGYAKKRRKLNWTAIAGEEPTMAEILHAWRLAQQRLIQLAAKHTVLVRVRELCRLYQRKWSLAGPLAFLDATTMRPVLDALTGRHLVLREGSERLSVHPAVRDHFARLNVSSLGAWHDLLREQLVSLVRRPGRQLPDDTNTLDLVEEAIHRALEAHQNEQAVWLYEHLLGGLRHLGWRLGEMSRGLRILRCFSQCPDKWALAWFLRALGEIEPAYAHNPLGYFRADIRLLQGRLPEVAAEGDEARTAVAAFLMGRTSELPPDSLGCAIPRLQVLLYCNPAVIAGRADSLDGLYKQIGWEGDRARCRLLAAEAARRQGDMQLYEKLCYEASVWVFHSGSVEHLCLLHLLKSRALLGAARIAEAQRSVEEGLHLARRCGLELFHIELLCEGAEAHVLAANGPAAEHLSREALRIASAASCQFAWGAAAAAHLVGQSLAIQRRLAEARPFVEKALSMRRRLGDPRAIVSERLIATLD
jgi:hypothetical protein